MIEMCHIQLPAPTSYYMYMYHNMAARCEEMNDSLAIFVLFSKSFEEHIPTSFCALLVNYFVIGLLLHRTAHHILSYS